MVSMAAFSSWWRGRRWLHGLGLVVNYQKRKAVQAAEFDNGTGLVDGAMHFVRQ